MNYYILGFVVGFQVVMPVALVCIALSWWNGLTRAYDAE